MSDPTKRIFQIHVVDVGPMPEAPADPTPSLARFVEEEVERRLGLMTHQLDGAHTRALRAEAGWQSAVDDFNRARARITEVETERDTVQKQFERMTEAADSWRAKYMEAVADPADLATLRRERDEALAAVEEWRAAANDRVIERDGVGEELATARAENVRLHNRVNALCDTDRNAARLVAMIAERDRAIAERDEARKALAAQIEKTNECTRALNAYPGVAELAALRARVAELEADQLSAWRNRDSMCFKGSDGIARDAASYFDYAEARIAELAATLAARTKRAEYLAGAIHAIQSLVDSV